ncbi:MAG: hypothetical protein WCW40_10575 [Bacteroidota bacterium]
MKKLSLVVVILFVLSFVYAQDSLTTGPAKATPGVPSANAAHGQEMKQQNMEKRDIKKAEKKKWRDEKNAIKKERKAAKKEAKTK